MMILLGLLARPWCYTSHSPPCLRLERIYRWHSCFSVLGLTLHNHRAAPLGELAADHPCYRDRDQPKVVRTKKNGAICRDRQSGTTARDAYSKPHSVVLEN